MKLSALLSFALLGCGLPAPPASAPETEDPPVTVDPPAEQENDDDDGVEEADIDAGPRPDSRPASSGVLSQTESETIEPGGSVVCADGGIPYENYYYRVFNLATEGVNSEFNVTAVDIGVETADGGDDGTQPVNVEILTLNGDILGGGLTSLATGSLNVADTTATHVKIPVNATIAAGSVVAVQVHIPDGYDEGDRFVIGANNDGQSAPGFHRAPECVGDDDIVELSSIGFPNVHLLIGLVGE